MLLRMLADTQRELTELLAEWVWAMEYPLV